MSYNCGAIKSIYKKTFGHDITKWEIMMLFVRDSVQTNVFSLMLHYRFL